MKKNTTISFHTIGCRMNQYETAVLENMFRNSSFDIVSPDCVADIAVVNTCTVTENSDTDTRRFVNRLIRLNPRVKIALVGCQAQLQSNILKDLPNVQWIIGNIKKFDLVTIVKTPNTLTPHIDITTIKKPEPFFMPAHGIDIKHTRANLKIQDGCDNFCTYCEVPYARGRARSRDFNDILKEARALVKAGHKEIILTGINTGAYQFQHKTILDVIKALDDLVSLKRIRISSIEPTRILPDIIRHMSRKTKLCRYLHLPIQHGHPDILKLMKRKYTIDSACRLISEAAQTVPDICIGTDVIVGFPGETDAHFDEMYNRLKILPIDYFHVFSFSKRLNAKAKDFPGQIGVSVIQTRSASLRKLSQRKRHHFHEHMIGKTVSVLFEQEKNGSWHGLTDNFIQVKVSSNNYLKNQIRRVQLTRSEGQEMAGELMIRQTKPKIGGRHGC